MANVPCKYCRRIKNFHLMFCPYENPRMQQVWESGYADALIGRANVFATEPVYNMGFTQGETDRRLDDAKEPLDEERFDPPSRDHVRPSLAEIQLENLERKKIVPSLLPPPHKARTGSEFVLSLVAHAETQLF